MKKRLFLVALAGSLAACGGGGGNGGTGSLSMGVSDAPVDEADEVVVTFTGIELLGDDGGVRQSFTFGTPQQVDLLQQQGDQQFFLIQGEQIPAGVYREVRLLVQDMDNASCNPGAPPYPNYIRIGSTTSPLIVPSGGSSGFKVKGPITVAAGGSAAYTVDFDLRKSIAERGTTGCYNLKPVLRVVDNAQVGRLAGTVDPALFASTPSCNLVDPTTADGVSVYVFTGNGVTPDDYDNNEPNPLTTALLNKNQDGTFSYTVGFLLAGNYTVALSCQAGDDLPPETSEPTSGDNAITFIQPTDAAISADETTVVDFPPPL